LRQQLRHRGHAFVVITAAAPIAQAKPIENKIISRHTFLIQAYFSGPFFNRL
jgi:hypothetical protein